MPSGDQAFGAPEWARSAPDPPRSEGLEELAALGDALEHLLGPQHLAPGRGQLDGQRQPVELLYQLTQHLLLARWTNPVRARLPGTHRVQLHGPLDVLERLEHELRGLEKRIHILEGFALVFDALDEIIRIIRASDGKADAAKKILKRIKKFMAR